MKLGVFYDIKTDTIYLGELLKEEFTHVLMTKDDSLWESTLIMDLSGFIYLGLL
jgi:hypothetical protein